MHIARAYCIEAGRVVDIPLRQAPREHAAIRVLQRRPARQRSQLADPLPGAADVFEVVAMSRARYRPSASLYSCRKQGIQLPTSDAAERTASWRYRTDRLNELYNALRR